MKYVSVHDLAWYWYCDLQAVMRAREKEKVTEAAAQRVLKFWSAALDTEHPVLADIDSGLRSHADGGMDWVFDKEPYMVTVSVDRLSGHSVGLSIKSCSNVSHNLYLMQAHMSAWLFGREKAELKSGLSSIVESTNCTKAERTWDCFVALDQGRSKPFRTKMEWKCAGCTYTKECKAYG